MVLCSYGCGKEGVYQLKNGKFCCREKFTDCQGYRTKISQGLKRAYKNGTLDAKQIYKNKSEESKRKMAWSKGKTKQTDESIKKQSETVKQKYAQGLITPSFTGRKHSEETKKLISERTSLNYNYTANRKSGRGKKGKYKGFWCDSTYELAFIIYCLDHNIPIERNKQYFTYEYQGKTKRYYPDFIIDGQIIEIKGFANETLPYKEQALKNAGVKYKILFPKDLKHVFDYILQKYNKTVDKNIHELYEQNAFNKT